MRAVAGAILLAMAMLLGGCVAETDAHDSYPGPGPYPYAYYGGYYGGPYYYDRFGWTYDQPYWGHRGWYGSGWHGRYHGWHSVPGRGSGHWH